MAFRQGFLHGADLKQENNVYVDLVILDSDNIKEVQDNKLAKEKS
jgi:hypothetical protein